MFGFRPRPKPHAPPGQRVYAVGDIHGRLDLLDRLLKALRDDNAAAAPCDHPPALVFLGDYIDRGLQSAAVIDRLLNEDWAPFQPRFLKGNHEAALLRFLESPDTGPGWMAFGGAETLHAYGLAAPALPADRTTWEAAAAALSAALPPEHLRFFKALEPCVRYGDYVFVHAGLRPGRALDSQTELDMLTIRDPFLNTRHAFPFTVVHGHTPVDAAEAKHGRIALDTGAYVTGRLSAVRLEREETSFLTT